MIMRAISTITLKLTSFIRENEEAGNVVTIIAPYFELVSMDEVPDIYKD